MSIALVQATMDAGTANEVTCAFDSTTVSGHLIVVALNFAQAEAYYVAEVTDNHGNTYQRAGSRQDGTGMGAVLHAEIWYAFNVTGGAAHVVTVHFDGANSSNVAIHLSEWSGVRTTDPLGGNNGNAVQFPADPAYDFGAGSVTPTEHGCLALAVFLAFSQVNIDGRESGWSALTTDPGGYHWSHYTVQAIAAETSGWVSFADNYEVVVGKIAWFLPAVAEVWVDVANFVEQTIDSSVLPGGVGRVLGYLWSSDASAVLQARLYNQTDGVSVGESSEVSADEPTAADFAVTLTSGTKSYRLQVTSDIPGVDIFWSGRGLGV